MNFSTRDMALIMVMVMAIVFMSFTFPALGLTDESDEVNESEIPELNMSSDRFDFAAEFPERPSTPTEGTLSFNESRAAIHSDNVIWLDGDTSSGHEMVLTPTGPEDFEVQINDWDTGSVVGESNTTWNYSDPDGTLGAIDNSTMGYGIIFELKNVTDEGGGNFSYSVDYEIQSSGIAGGTVVGRLPVIGSVLGASSTVAAYVGWAVTVFLWFSLWLVTMIANLFDISFSVATFTYGVTTWLFGSYLSIISSANSWAAVIVAIPGLILSLLVSKLAFVIIDILWIG